MTCLQRFRLGHSRVAAALFVGIAFPACSKDEATPAKATPTGGAAVPASGPVKKGGKLKPGAQIPGGADYEDKPGSRGRGR